MMRDRLPDYLEWFFSDTQRETSFLSVEGMRRAVLDVIIVKNTCVVL